MERESLEIEIVEISLNVKNSSINSVRRKEVTRRAARVFKEGSLGLAAAQGDVPFDDLFKRAENALALGIEWNYDLPTDTVYTRDATQGLDSLTEDGICSLGETVLKQLTSRNPDFIFSDRIGGARKKVRLENSKGISLSLATQETEIGLTFKHRESSNIIDGYHAAGWLRDVNTEEYIERYNEILDGYRNSSDLKSARRKVVFLNEGMVMAKFREVLRGDRYYRGASLLSEKIGEKIFSENFTLYDSNDLVENGYCSPFDMEGVKREESDLVLIEHGVLRDVVLDLRNGAKYGRKSTGNGYRAYSQNPDIRFNALRVERGKKTLDEILDGEEALVVLLASGGDFLDNGDFSTPVQLSFTYGNGKFIGRAPQVTLKSNLLRMFGEDLVGISCDSFMSDRINPYLIMEMDMEVH